MAHCRALPFLQVAYVSARAMMAELLYKQERHADAIKWAHAELEVCIDFMGLDRSSAECCFGSMHVAVGGDKYQRRVVDRRGKNPWPLPSGPWRARVVSRSTRLRARGDQNRRTTAV